MLVCACAQVVADEAANRASAARTRAERLSALVRPCAFEYSECLSDGLLRYPASTEGRQHVPATNTKAAHGIHTVVTRAGAAAASS